MIAVNSSRQDSGEADFYRHAEALGLRDRVLVTGYIEDAGRLAGIFGQIDVFCYPFAEGLTARRASVLAAALSGKPVVVRLGMATGSRTIRSLLR